MRPDRHARKASSAAAREAPSVEHFIVVASPSVRVRVSTQDPSRRRRTAARIDVVGVKQLPGAARSS